MCKNSIENIIDIEIAIVGAGPAGIAAAIELSKLGHAKDIMVFDREDQVAMTSRHCNHQGFGLMEFQRPLDGSGYANKLAKKAKEYYVNTKLKHSLTKVDGDTLTFSTPDGEVCYRAKRILFAMGARESTRPALLVSGGRSPNIITTGALQRFTYIQERKPFSKAVIIGSEIVSFSAIMTAKHAGIEIVGIIEEQEHIQSFRVLKPLSKYLLKTPVYTASKLISINAQDKVVESVTISTNGVEKTINCDGVIFSGAFTPESSILQKSLEDFNRLNLSTHITQNFQTNDKRYFLAGNVIRGALTAFNCYFEGRTVGKKIHASLQSDKAPDTIQIKADSAIAWYYPSLIDINTPQKILSKIRFTHPTKGLLRIFLNGKQVMQQNINAVPYSTITVDWFNMSVKAGDKVEMQYEEA